MGSAGLDGCRVGVSQFSLALHHPQILLSNTSPPSSVTEGSHPSQCGPLLSFILLSIPQISVSSWVGAALVLPCLSLTPWAPARSQRGGGQGTLTPILPRVTSGQGMG